jgi:hypothetical protein
MAGSLIIRNNLDAQAKEHIPLLLTGVVLPLSLTFLIVESYWLALAAVGGLGALSTLMAIKPRDALSLVFAYLPFQSLLNDIFAGSVPVIAVCKDVLMVVIISSFLLRYFRRSLYANGVIYFLAAFMALSALYIPFSPDQLRAVLQLRCMTLYPFIVILVANLIETPQDLRRLLRVVAILGVVTVAYGLVQYLTMFDVPYRNAGGSVMQRMGRFDEFGVVSTFASRPDFGGYLIPLFLLFFQVALWPSSRAVWIFRWVMLTAIAVCLALTYSRTSWLATLVGLFVTVYARDRAKAILWAVAAAACLLIAYQTKNFFLPPSLDEAATSSESFFIRLSYWPRVFRHVLANPMGLGLGTVGGAHLFESRSQTDSYGNLQYDPNTLFDPTGGLGADNILSVTDNNYLKLLIQGGFPMLTVFLLFIAFALTLARWVLGAVRDQWLRDVAIWATASFVSLLTIFMFVDFMESVPATSVYWLAIGALCFVKKTIR